MRTLVVGMAYTVVTLPVDGFPVAHAPVRDARITTSVGGSGFTVARTLAALGNEVFLAAPLGEDADAVTVDAAAYGYGVNSAMCPRSLPRSPRAVVLEGPDGHRQVNRDLGEARSARVELDLGALATADLLLVDGVLPAEALISGAQAAGVPVAVGLGAMCAPPGLDQLCYLGADVVVMGCGPEVDEEVLLRTWRRRSVARLVVVTLGARGAIGLAAGSEEVIRVPARDLGPGRRPAGLGSTYFATLSHYVFARGCDPRTAMEYAATAAGWTIAHHDSPSELSEDVVEAAGVPGAGAVGVLDEPATAPLDVPRQAP